MNVFRNIPFQLHLYDVLFLVAVALCVASPSAAHYILIDDGVKSYFAWFLLVAAFFRVVEIVKEIKQNSAQTAPDPKKWHFDKESGEYFRITGHHKGHVIYDTTPYSARILQDYGSSRVRRAGRGHMIIYVAVILFFSYVVYRGVKDSTISLPLIVFGALAVPWAGMRLASEIFGSLSSYLKSDVGPPPVAPPGLDDVRDQMAYGNAGPADLASIHSALSGNAPVAPSPAVGPRLPLFDE